jgi:ATP-dependent Clp protease adaptor protein ClpS
MNSNSPDVITKQEQSLETKEPKSFAVILLNDNKTTINFVITVLMHVFAKSLNDAETLTLQIHNQGQAIAGIYTREIAFAKVSEVKELAKINNFPLKSKVEEV